MSQFYDVNWQGHKSEFGVGDNWRKVSRCVTIWTLFRKDSLPYLNQVPLYFDCTVTPPVSLGKSETITYQHRLKGVEDGKIYSLKSGNLEITPNGKTKIKLITDIIQRTIQYTGEIRFGVNEVEVEKEGWQLFVSMTVLDKDIYSMDKIMTRVVDAVWLIVGVVATIIIQKIFGVI